MRGAGTHVQAASCPCGYKKSWKVHILIGFQIDPRKSVSLRMIKWVLSCLEGKGLLRIGVLAFDMSHAGAGLCSMYMMGSARKGDTLTLGQPLVPGSAQSSRPTASPQIPNREWGLQNPALAPAGAGDTTLCSSTCSQSRDQKSRSRVAPCTELPSLNNSKITSRHLKSKNLHIIYSGSLFLLWIGSL